MEPLRGFTVIELMVVAGICAILLGLLLPVINRVMGHGAAVRCSANLSQLGQALSTYAVDNRGFIPRYGRYAEPTGPNYPMWLVAVAPRIGAPRNWTWSDLPKLSALQCPKHPVAGIPSGYVQNNFAFETQPDWRGSPPVQLGSIKNTARVPWLLEATNSFGPSIYGSYDAIFFEPYHSVRTPDQLATRVEWARHSGRKSNVLFFDGHVAAHRSGEIPLESFNDQIARRFLD
jgi:prepilin-type processing-associated H-X9-DG protein